MSFVDVNLYHSGDILPVENEPYVVGGKDTLLVSGESVVQLEVQICSGTAF